MPVDHQDPHHIQAAARAKLAAAAGAAAQRAEALFKAGGPIEPAIQALEAATRAFTAAFATPAVPAPLPAPPAHRALRVVRIPPGGAVTSDTAELKQWRAVLGAVRAAVAASVHAGHPKYRDPSNPDDAGTGDGPSDTPTPETPTPETPTPETPTTGPGTPPPTDTPPPTTPDTPPPTTPDTPPPTTPDTPPTGTLPDAGSAATVLVLGTPLEDAALGVAAQIAAALGVALAPAAVAGILIVMALTLSSDAAPEEVDCKKVKEACGLHCEAIFSKPWNVRDLGGLDWFKCRRNCMEEAGCYDSAGG